MTKWMTSLAGLALALASAPLLAQPPSGPMPPAFHKGPVFEDFGMIADVDADFAPAKNAVLKVVFTSGDASKRGSVNNTIDSAARFINMNVAAGVPLENIHVAIVLHGPPGWDLTKDDAYGPKHDGKPNGSAKAVAALLSKGVQIYLCGQSAAGMGIRKDMLLPGVKLALSYLDASVLLQQQGYALIPD